MPAVLCDVMLTLRRFPSCWDWNPANCHSPQGPVTHRCSWASSSFISLFVHCLFVPPWASLGTSYILLLPGALRSLRLALLPSWSHLRGCFHRCVAVLKPHPHPAAGPPFYPLFLCSAYHFLMYYLSSFHFACLSDCFSLLLLEWKFTWAGSWKANKTEPEYCLVPNQLSGIHWIIE